MSAIRIEIAEDERIQARAMAGELEAMGYSICAVAGSGQAAIAKALETRPDLILMDIRLPGELDGIEAADQIRRTLDIPIVFVTAFTDAATLERAKISGPLGYVLKPAQSSELRTAIEVALHNHAAACRLRESEARYRGLFEGVPIGLYRISPEPRILEANDALIQILGYPDRASLLAIEPMGVFKDLADIPKLAEALTSSPDQASVDVSLQCYDGSTIWARIRPRPVFDQAGQVLHYEGSLEDITQRKLAEDEAQRSAAHARALAKTAALLNARLDLDVVLQTICEATTQAMGAPAASLLLYDEARDALIPAASCGAPSASFPGPHPVPRHMYDEYAGPDGSFFLIPDAAALHGSILATPPPAPPVTPVTPVMDVRTILGASLIRHGRLMGSLLIFSFGEPRTFGADEIALLKGLADQASQAISNARLYQSERAQVKQMAAINSLGRALSQTVDQEHIYDQLAAATAELLPDISGVAISLLDPDLEADSRQLTCVYASIDGEKLAADALTSAALEPPGAGAQSDAVHRRGPVITHKQTHSQTQTHDLQARPAEQRAGAGCAQSGVCVPLMVQDRVVGVLQAQSRAPGRFTPADGHLLALVANTGAVAIENARLVTKLQVELAARQRAMEDLRASEEALRHANHLLERTLAGLDEVVLVGDAATRQVVFCSPAVEQVFGYRPEEVIGHPIDMLHLSSEAAAAFQRKRKELSGPDGICHLEYRMRRKDGSVFPSENKVAPLNDAMGGPSLVVSVIRDITERKEQQRELEGLVAVATALRRARTVDEMAPAVLEQVVTLLNADAAALSLLDPATGDSHVLLGLGAWSQRTGSRRPADSGLTAKVTATRETHVSQDVVAEEGEAEADVFGEARALACSPLIVENEVIGALWLGRKSGAAAPAVIKPGEVHLLEGIADMAATAIQRARLDGQTNERLQRLNALHTIDLAISGSMDLHITLGIILDAVLSQLRVDAATILSLDSPARSLHLSAARGLRSAALRNHTVRLGEGMPGRAALEREIVGGPLPLAAKDPAGGDWRIAALKAEGIVTQYCVPLISKGQVKGVLEALHRSLLAPGQEWQDFLSAIGKQSAIAMENAELFEVLRRSNADLMLAYDTTLEGWSTALDMRDDEAVGHSRRVMAMTVGMAELLKMPEQEIVYLRRGALLHDIGKLAVPDSILRKEGPLTDEEWAVMRRHPQNSHDMLHPIAYLRPSLDIVYSHHENWDGSGYPHGLKGEEIPFGARIFSIVNVWDALTSHRRYRAAMSRGEASEHMRQRSGTQFDPGLLETFFAMLEQDGEGA